MSAARGFWTRWLLGMGLALCLAVAGGRGLAAPLPVDPGAGRIDMSKAMSILPDPGQRLDLAAVLARPDAFRPVTGTALVTGFNAGATWLRLSLRQTGDQPVRRWLVVGSAKTQRVTLFLRQGEDWRSVHSGRNVALRDKPVVALEPVFPLDLPPGRAVDLLLRVDSSGATNMATTLWQPDAYRLATTEGLMKLSALLGGLLVGAALALIVFGRLRESQYFWLGLTLVAVAGLEASRSNLLGTYFWPVDSAPPPQLLVVFALGALFGEAKVAAHALGLRQRHPAADRLFLVLRWVAVLGAGLAWVDYGLGVRIMSVCAVLLHLAIVGLALLVWRRGHGGAGLFLFAFSLGLLTETARQLANLRLLPWIAAMEFSVFFYLLASLFILLGLAEQTRALRQRLETERQLRAAKSAFLARVSHELRAPLNTILGFNRMLARQSARLSLAEGTTGIEKSALRLLRLIDELLDSARSAAGKLRVHPAPLRLAPWLEELAATARLGLEPRGNRLHCAFSGDLDVTLELDGERLRQVLENLISNANRHTRDGRIRLECRATPLGPQVRLDFAVEDDGEGIAADRVASIFEPFERGAAEAAGPRSGFGLGLSICRELVQQMGGEIHVHSTPGQGSRFDFTLNVPWLAETRPRPDGPATVEREAGPAAAPRPGTTERPDGQVRPGVLLVEDDPAQLGALADLLEAAGFRVGLADGGRRGIEALAEGDWQAVVTDQWMPDGDGWRVLRQVRHASPDLPVVLLSAESPAPPADHPAGLAFDAVLLKPCPPETLLATLWDRILAASEPDALSPSHWQALAELAEAGDVSGIEDWIAARRSEGPGQAATLRWLEGGLHRLELDLLRQFARRRA